MPEPRYMSRFGLVVAGMILLQCGLVSMAAAGRSSSGLVHCHPNHFSSAEVRWNEKTGKFEVALCVWPADLEKALTQLAAKPVDLDTTEGLDDWIAHYVADKFLIRKAPLKPVTGEDSPADPASDPTPPQAADVKPQVPAAEPESNAEGASHSTANNPSSTSDSASSPAPDSTLASEPAQDPAPNTGEPRKPTRHQHEDHFPDPPQTDPTTADGKPAPVELKKLPDGFRWVGFESNLKEAWLYFELKGDLEPANWEIENRVFFEFNEEQVNQIRFSSGGQTRSYSLKINQPTWQFSTERKDVRNRENSPSRE